MTVTDNLPAVRVAPNLPTINVFLDEAPSAEVDLNVTQYRLVNPWQWPCLISLGLTATTAISAFAVSVLTEDHIEHATGAVLASLVLLLILRGMSHRYERRVRSRAAFKPIN